MSKSTEINANKVLINHGFRPWGIYLNKEFPEALALLALDLARQKYSDIRLLPSEIAIQGRGFEFYESFKNSHILYVKLSDSSKAELEKEGPTGIVIMIPVKRTSNGEMAHFRLEDLMDD